MRSLWDVVALGCVGLLLLGCDASTSQVSQGQSRQTQEDGGAQGEAASLTDLASQDSFHAPSEYETPELQKAFTNKGWTLYTDFVGPTAYKVVTLRDMRGVTLDDLDLIVQSKVMNYLDLSGLALNDDVLKKLPQMENLEVLRIDGQAYIDDQLQALDITDTGIAALAQCPQLNILLLRDADQVSDAGLASLATLKNLEAIYISGVNLTGEFLQAFAGHPKLTSVTLGEGSSVTDEGLAQAAKIPHLDQLAIKWQPWDPQGLKLTRAGVAALVNERVPQHLEVPTKLIDDELFVKMIEAGWLPPSPDDPPATPDQLRLLLLKGYDISDQGFTAAMRFQHAVMVVLEGLEISDEAFARLKEFAELRSLHLYKMPISGPAIDAISGLPLEELVIEGGELSEDHFLAFGKLKQLTDLSLPETKFDPAWIVHLQELPELRSLNLRAAAFDDAAAEFVAKMPSLEGLNVNYTELTDAGFAAILKAPRLQTIHIAATKVTEEAIEAARKKFADKSIND